MNREALRYQQARQEILALIERQGLKPGARLPSEEALGEQLGVSRNTVRDALLTLERDGLVVRRHGMGTYLAAAPAPLQTRLNEILPIPELIRASGCTPGVADLAFDRRTAPAPVHETLQVPVDAPLGVLSLLHLADGKPAIYITYYLIPELSTRLARWEEFDGHMQNLVESSPSLRIYQTVARIHAVSATAEIAAILQLRLHAPVLMFNHTAYTAEGRPVYFSTSYQDSNLLGVMVVRRRT
ncbi:MAG TPA: GntR family transcriptional regulator [Anaerolineae bacterium]